MTRAVGERLPAFANKHAQAQAIRDDLREPTDTPTSEVTKKYELRMALERVTKLTPTQRVYIKQLPFYATDDNKLIDHYTGLEEAKRKEELEAETSSQSLGDVYTVAAAPVRGPPPAAQECSHCKKPHATSECWSLLALQKGIRGNLGGENGKGRGGGRNGNQRNNAGRGSGGTYQLDKTCFRCGSVGHFAAACTNPLGVPTTVRPASVCFKCAKPGHIARWCNSPDDNGAATRTLLANDPMDLETVLVTGIVQDCMGYVLTVADALNDVYSAEIGTPLGVLVREVFAKGKKGGWPGFEGDNEGQERVPGRQEYGQVTEEQQLPSTRPETTEGRHLPRPPSVPPPAPACTPEGSTQIRLGTMANPVYRYGQAVLPESDTATGLVFLEELASNDEPAPQPHLAARPVRARPLARRTHTHRAPHT